MFPPKPPPDLSTERRPRPEKLPPYMEAAGLTAWPDTEEECPL